MIYNRISLLLSFSFIYLIKILYIFYCPKTTCSHMEFGVHILVLMIFPFWKNFNWQSSKTRKRRTFLQLGYYTHPTYTVFALLIVSNKYARMANVSCKHLWMTIDCPKEIFIVIFGSTICNKSRDWRNFLFLFDLLKESQYINLSAYAPNIYCEPFASIQFLSNLCMQIMFDYVIVTLGHLYEVILQLTGFPLIPSCRSLIYLMSRRRESLTLKTLLDLSMFSIQMCH